MNGHEPLLTMRRSGGVPRAVWVADGEAPRSTDWHREPNCCDGEYHAVVRIDPQDIPEVLDLRWAIGLEVHLTAERGEPRARRLHEALIAAQARRVITSIHGASGVDLILHGVSNG